MQNMQTILPGAVWRAIRLLLVATTLAGAQSRVTGSVRTATGVPLAGVNVFVLETLDGATTDSLGVFAFTARPAPAYTLTARRIGLKVVQRAISGDSLAVPIALTMEPVTLLLDAVRVEAGTYRLGTETGATLSSIDVVTTPGSTADVYRAIQVLPGVAAVDEGTGLYVRGGDFSETRVFLNGVGLLNPAKLATPLGTFVGRIDPFQLDGIYFSSGGFGARYGDALSGVASLRSLGFVDVPQATLSAGIGHVSVGGALPVTNRLGVRVAGNKSDLRQFIRLNGANQKYEPAPRSLDGSVTAVARYGDSAEVKAFAYADNFDIGVDAATSAGRFRNIGRSGLSVVSWRDPRAASEWNASVALAHSRSDEFYGDYRLRFAFDDAQAFASWRTSLAANRALTLGAEAQRKRGALTGTNPPTSDGPGRVVVFDDDTAGTRIAGFAELDWRITSRLRATTGIRADRSDLTGATTLDPRFSAAWGLKKGLTVTASIGTYHQVPDPLLIADSASTIPPRASMRAHQAIIGIEAADSGRAVRVEAYAKRYAHLAAFDAEYRARGNGAGSAEGLDVFAKSPMARGFSLRATLSVLRSRRTDPLTGVSAPAPFDVTHTAIAILDWNHRGLAAAIGYRYATGRPYTPVRGAEFSETLGQWMPQYAAPMSERLPPFQRSDVSLSNMWRTRSGIMIIAFASLMNVADRVNVQNYHYSDDYTRRISEPAIFNRSVYFGAVIEH